MSGILLTKLLIMKKQITFLLFTLLFALTSSHVMAQKHVLYVIGDGVKIYNDDQIAGTGYGKNASDKTYGVTTKSSLFGNDPVLKMLKADSNFSVTYIIAQNGATVPLAKVTNLTLGSAGLPVGNTLVVGGDIDTTGFDLIIVTENVSGTYSFVKGGATPGKLAPSNLTAPIIYAKSLYFKNASLVTSTTATSITTQNLSMQVVNAASPIFTGITVSNGSSIPLLRTTSDDYGAAAGQKAIDIVNGLEISGATNTLLATVPEITVQNPGQTAIGINFFPKDTQLGTDVSGILAKDAIVLPFSWGATVKQDGGNITPELLTIWRNAAYMLTGQTIPSGMVANPAANSYEIASTTHTYDFRNGTFINTTVGGTLLETLTPDLAVDGANNLNAPGAIGTTAQYKSDIVPFFSPTIAQARVDYIVGGGANFYNATDGINLKAGSKLQVKPYGTGQITIPLLATSDLDYAMSGANINSKAWIVVNGVSKNGPTNINPYTETFDGTAGTANEIVIDVYATTGNSINFTFTADAALGGTDMYVPYVNVKYSYLQEKPKEILYVQKTGFASASGASLSTNDPIFRMFTADPKFNITVVEVPAAGTGLDLTGYDLVIAQETFGSGDGIWSGAFDVQTNTTPIIFNKSWAWQKSKNHIVSAAAAITVSPSTSVTIDLGNQTNTLFNGIDFAGGTDIMLYNTTSNNFGADGTNSIDVLNNIEIGAPSTNLASVSDVTTSPDTSIIINDIPQGTQIGTLPADVLKAPMVAFAFNYGAIIKGDGANITSEALTIWRNAAYKLTGLTVPTTLYINPDYVTLGIDKVGEVSAVTTNVKSIGNRIYVSNVKSTTEVNIYSITGALVKSFKTNTDTDFNFKTGLWIATVKTFEGQKAVKLLTK